MIVLISDNKDISLTIREDLANEGFNVEIFDDFAEALLRLEQRPKCNLILVDFEYKGHDVFDICQKIKRKSQLKLIPLICILDKNRVVDQLLAFEMGADDFIFLPYTSLDIQLKMRSIHRLVELQTRLQKKDMQLENLQNVQRIMVTLNHYINNALTPLYFAVQIMDVQESEEVQRLKDIAGDTVEFVSKVLQSLHKIVQSGKSKIVEEGVYKDIMFDIEHELNDLLEKTK